MRMPTEEEARGARELLGLLMPFIDLVADWPDGGEPDHIAAAIRWVEEPTR